MKLIEEGHIFLQDGDKILAEVKFIDKNGVYNINKTFVDESLRGQGIASKLIKAVIIKAKNENKHIKPICHFAKKWFERHNEYKDILSL